jgi:hypothetical protein
MKRAKVLAMVVGSFAMLVLSLSPVPALAISILDFSVPNQTAVGGISYGGGSTPLVGSGISVSSVVGIGTPSDPGNVHACLGCTLAFSTGASTGSWTWGSGGGSSIMLTGTVDLNDNTIADDGGTGTLLTGSFGTAQVVPLVPGALQLAFSSFTDTKDPVLTAHYGLPTGPYAGSFTLQFLASAVPPGSFSSTQITTGNVSNAIPEASSLFLLGAGLLGLAFWGRKKLKGVN